MKLPRMFLNRILLKSGPPLHIIWFITSKCNLRCSHCFYHSQLSSNKDELSFDEIKKTIEHLSPLLSISLTGGEPFLREDLVEIAGLFSKRKLTDNITLFTNGLDTERILEKTQRIASVCPTINISLGVSIDGFEAEHDFFRNKKGSYERATATIRKLKKLENSFPNLKIGVGITLHKGNQNIIHKLREDVYRKFGIKSGITLVRGNAKLASLKNVDANIFKETIKALEQDGKVSKHKTLLQTIIDTREILGQRLAYNTYTTQTRSYDCYGGSLMGIIYENGDVYPCEMLKESKFGNLRNFDYNIKKIWNSEKANEVRKLIKRKECYCTYECQYTCNTLYNIKFLAFFVKNILIRPLKR